MRRWTGPTARIFAGLILGVVVGRVWPRAGVAARPLADLFLRMIKMIIAPLVFSTLAAGIAGAGDAKAVGRIGLKAFVYFEAATSVALVLGLGLVNLFRPGAGIGLTPVAGAAPVDTASLATITGSQPHAWDLVLRAFPTSVVDAMARGDILQIVVFATFFGLAAMAIGSKARPVVDVLDAVAQVMFTVTGYVMLFAPVGVFGAIASTVGGNGLIVLAALGKLVGLMYLGLAMFALVVFGGVCRIVGVPFLAFMAAIREPCLIAFSTASSEAALPKAFDAMEQFGVPKSIVGFVLPAGYSFNLDGSTLYLALTSVFIAQLAGVQMTWGQQGLMMVTLMLASKGVAGVPRGALVVLTATLGQFNLPLEGAAILLGIDQIMDMGRTAVNVTGNCLATVVVARWEGIKLSS